MQAKLIVILIIAILVIIFTIQNQAPVNVTLIVWSFDQVPVSIVIFFSILLGAVITFLFGLRVKAKLGKELKAKSAKIGELERGAKTRDKI